MARQEEQLTTHGHPKGTGSSTQEEWRPSSLLSPLAQTRHCRPGLQPGLLSVLRVTVWLVTGELSPEYSSTGARAHVRHPLMAVQGLAQGPEVTQPGVHAAVPRKGHPISVSPSQQQRFIGGS